MPAEPRFALSEREQELLARAQDIAEDAAHGMHGPLSREEVLGICRRLEPLGYLASILPRDRAPRAPGSLAFAALVEGLSPALPLLGNHSVQRYINEYGSPDQIGRFLPPLLAGESIAAIAITEPNAGADLKKLSTRAEKTGHSYVLTGGKTWVTHGLVADLAIVLAMADEGPTRFIVPLDSPRVERVPMTPVGLSHLTFAQLRFDRCEVPDAHVLGSVGRGLDGAKSAFPIARALAALQAIRIGEAAIAIALDFAADRTVFERRLVESSLVQDGIADLRSRFFGARLLAYRSMASLAGPAAGETAAMSKAMGCRAALDACRFAMELLGSAGLSGGTRLELLHDDARMMAVVDGTVALNRFVVARRARPPIPLR